MKVWRGSFWECKWARSESYFDLFRSIHVNLTNNLPGPSRWHSRNSRSCRSFRPILHATIRKFEAHLQRYVSIQRYCIGCSIHTLHACAPLHLTCTNLELVRRDSRSDEREERRGKKYKGFGRDGEDWETIGDYSTFLEKRYRLSKELASEYISFAFVSSHKVECKKKGVQVGQRKLLSLS